MKKSSKDSNPEVSVIIVNYNTGKLLLECVKSVVKSYPGCEIIVVDNNSSDGSIDLIQNSKRVHRGADKIQNYNSKLKIIANNSNPGFSKANNQAITIAKGKYILLLNPDTKILGGAIKSLVDFAKKHPFAGVIVPQLLNEDGSIQDSIMPFPTIFRAIQEFLFGQKVYSKHTLKSNNPQEIEAAVMAAFLITEDARTKVGLLDEKYFMYFEDLDYCRRVWNQGLKVYYLPTAQVIHYHGVSGKNLSDDNTQWKRLIPSSKLYHGTLKYYLINFIIWFGTRVIHR